MENIKETIAKLEKGLDNPYITDDIKVKISEKIAELKAELEPKPAPIPEPIAVVETKVEPTLDDLTKRLGIVNKMAKKDPTLKARVKIIEKMIEKTKKNQQNNDYEVVFASDDSILISDGNKIIKWNFTGEKEEFKDEKFFKTLKNTLTFDVVKANSFDDAYDKVKKPIKTPQNITETIGYKIVKTLGGFGDGSGDEKAILDSYSDIIPQLTKAATEPVDKEELIKLIIKFTKDPNVSSDLEILRKHKVLDLGKFESRIYRAADRMTDEEFKDLSETLSKEETKTYESLIRLGDEPKLALATVLDKREVVNNKTAAEPIKELYLKEISTRAGVRKEAVNEFAIANGLTNQDMLTIVQGLGRGMLAPQDFVTAIVGNDRGRKSYTKKVLDFIKSGKAWKVEKKPTTEKLYSIQNNIGKSKYVVNYHDGVKKHKDGSAFYDISIFKNKKDLENFIKKLEREGYKEKYENGGEILANIASIRGLMKKAVDGKYDRTTVEKGNYRINMIYEHGVLHLSFYYLDYNHPRFNPDVVNYAEFTYKNNKGTLELFDKDVYNKKGGRVNIKPLIEKTIEALSELDYSVDEIIDETEQFGNGGEVSLIIDGYEYQMISSPTMSYLKKSYKEELKNKDYSIIELPASHPDRKRGNKFGLFKKPKIAKGGSVWIQKATKQMEKKGTKGLFTERAEARGLTAVEFAKKVLANPNRYTKTIQKEAQFVKNTNPELFN